MRKKGFFFLFIISISMLLAGCPGLADYSYDVAGNYELSRSSAHQVSVIPKDGWSDESEIIPPKVVKIAWNEQFVIAEQQILQPRTPNDPTDSYEEPSNEFAYWILDTTNRKSYGPFIDKEQLKAEMKRMNIPETMKLIDVESYKQQ